MASSIFLAASFPDADSEEASYSHSAEIAAAVAAVAEGALRANADLVFGGHPTVTPIVLQIAMLLDRGRGVHIFQSEFFSDVITDDATRLVNDLGAHLHWTPGAESRSDALRALRVAMFQRQYTASFFVGGMGGVVEEARLLAEMQPAAPQFYVAAPGGAASQLAAMAGSHNALGLTGRGYASLVIAALQRVELWVRPSHPDET